MALTRPTASSKVAFDATQPSVFSFTSSGGDQVVKNRITIRNNSTNAVVYQNTVTSFAFNQTVPANTLTNGVYYNYYFNTYNVNDDISGDSNVVAFRCYSSPTITFTNTPSTNIIDSQNYLFTFRYAQAQGELMDSITFNLYNSNNETMTLTGNTFYSTQTPPIDFSYLVSGFEDNESYSIQCRASSINGTISESVKYSFVAIFEQPEIVSVFSATNNCEDGCVDIQSNLIVGEGIVSPSPPLYMSKIMDGNEASYIQWDEWFTTLTNDKISVWADRYALDMKSTTKILDFLYGFSISSSFQYQLWMKPYQSGDIGYLYKTGNELNRFVVSIRSGTPSGEGSIKSWVEIKTENGSLFKSSAYVNRLRVDSDIVVWFKKVGDAYDVLLDVISAGTGSFIGGSTTSTYTATSSTINVDSLFPFDVVQLRNGAYDNFNITIDTNGVYSRNFPEYDYYTRINCNFDDNLKISDASDVLLSTRKLRIKRRIVGEFEWVLIYEVNTEDLTTFSISERDYLTPTGKRFEYALVPVLDGDIEADYITTQVDTNFSWCYLCDGDTSLKFYTNVTYPTITSSVASGLHVPIGRRFPITVYNSENDFESGTFNGDILGANFLDTRRINRAEVQAQLTIAKRFINNKKSKILKDWDGRCKLVDTNISNGMTENVDLINGKVNVSFNFVEKGEWNNQQDLYDNGIIHYSSN